MNHVRAAVTGFFVAGEGGVGQAFAGDVLALHDYTQFLACAEQS